MKGRVLIVDDNSFKVVEEKGVWGPKLPELKTKWNITIIDIISDMLNFQIGDYVILWKVKGSIIDSNEFYGIYRVISKPYIDKECFEYEEDTELTNYPFRVKLEKAYKFKNPILEYNFINDINIKNDIWTIIGKKVKGKSRASTPITEEIIQLFIKKFIDLNDKWQYVKRGEEVIISDGILKLDLSNKVVEKIKKRTKEENDKIKIEEAKIFKESYDMDLIKTLNYEGNDITCEKLLEGLFNQYIGETLNGVKSEEVIEKIVNEDEFIKWYFNYLPYGLEGTEIDFMIALSKDRVNISKILVIEFMMGKLDIDHIKRTFLYSQWVNMTLCDNSKLAEAIVIAKSIPKGEKFENIKKVIQQCKEEYNIKKCTIMTYCIEENELKLVKV